MSRGQWFLRLCRIALAANMVLSIPAVQAAEPHVRLEFFNSEGCPDCETVKFTVLPVLQQSWGDSVEIVWRDTDVESNVVALIGYLDRFGIKRNDSVVIVVDGRQYLGGVREIRDRLQDVVAAALGSTIPTAISNVPPEQAASSLESSSVTRFLARFTLGGVALAGLVDGVNPCAFATVVFFASLLAVARIGRRGVLLIGLAFLLATFATYFTLGLGLLQGLHKLRALAAWQWAGHLLNAGFAVVLTVLAALSLRDAWRYLRSGQPADVTIQLPDVLKRRIHGFMRARLRPSHLVASGFAIGAMVTLLESVCTGQVYLPALMVMARESQHRFHGLGLLALYNLMFVVPVAIVMLAAWRGTGSAVLVRWSQRNVVWGKGLMAAFYIGLAVLVLLL